MLFDALQYVKERTSGGSQKNMQKKDLNQPPDAL